MTHNYAIKTVNSNGFYMTQGDVDGDPKGRIRYLFYCLFHDAQAICGDGQVMKLSDPAGNMLPHALSILRSVEFIDPATVKPVAPVNAASAAAR